MNSGSLPAHLRQSSFSRMTTRRTLAALDFAVVPTNGTREFDSGIALRRYERQDLAAARTYRILPKATSW
jgi:hypothetical protein